MMTMMRMMTKKTTKTQVKTKKERNSQVKEGLLAVAEYLEVEHLEEEHLEEEHLEEELTLRKNSRKIVSLIVWNT